MIPIFFFWTGSTNTEDIRDLGIMALCERWSAHPLKTSCVGVMYAGTQQARIIADTLHPSLLTFPGPNGALSDKHVKHFAKEFPNAKKGDAMRGVLASLYAQLNDEHFNPDHY